MEWRRARLRLTREDCEDRFGFNGKGVENNSEGCGEMGETGGGYSKVATLEVQLNQFLK